jgi:broad specificity phosphatase PhoE
VKITILTFRHPVSTGNKKNIFQGKSREDDGLAREGILQARAIADYLKRYGVVSIFSSPLKRTLELASEIQVRHPARLAINLDDGLAEISHGKKIDGRPFQEIKEQHPDEWRKWEAGITDEPAFPDGESILEVAKRGFKAISKAKDVTESTLRKRGEKEGITVVCSHGGTLAWVLAQINKVPLSMALDVFPLKNGSLSVIVWEDGWWRTEEVNYTLHLGKWRYTAPLLPPSLFQKKSP